MSINQNITFRPLNIAVLTVSDTRTEENDTSGDLLVSRLTESGHSLSERKIVRDNVELIAHQFREWIKRTDVDVILSTGGTGLT